MTTTCEIGGKSAYLVILALAVFAANSCVTLWFGLAWFESFIQSLWPGKSLVHLLKELLSRLLNRSKLTSFKRAAGFEAQLVARATR